MLVIHCPHCRKGMATLAAEAGQTFECPHCKKRFNIGGETTPPSPEPAPSVPPKAPSSDLDSFEALLAESVAAKLPEPAANEPPPEPDVVSSRLVWIMGGVASFLSLVLVILLVVWLQSPAPPNVVAVEPKVKEPSDVEDPEPRVASLPEPVEKSPTTPAPPKVDPPKQKVAPPAPIKNEYFDEEHLTKLLARLNDMRKAAGLGPVTIDADLSRGCEAHARYVNVNRHHPKLADVAGLQDEDSSLPLFNVDGQKASRSSMLAFAEPSAALEIWLGRISSRPPLLHPDLRAIGVGAAKSNRGEWVTVLDPLRGVASMTSVAYPAPNQTQVPLTFSGGPEVSDPAAGFPISLQFPINATPTAITAVLLDEQGNLVPTSVSTPENPLPRVRRPGLIGMIPKQPLQPKSVYRARISGQLDGRPFAKDWTFTTEDDGDEDGAMAIKMLRRINRLREQAGLKPVSLDTVISKACRLHAKYLVVNAHRPEVQEMGAHKEDKNLPGYTDDGAKAAKASDIALGDYEPADALDGWMATLYHRVPILEPDLRQIGFGCARGKRLGWVTVLDVFTRREPGKRTQAVFWPVDKQTGVPLNFPPGGETPNPIPNDKTGRAGYPITAFFPYQTPVTNARATLEDDKGQPVACWFSSKESPANPKFVSHQGNTVCLIPKEPLRPEQTYRVTITGDAFKKTWTFTTAKSGVASNDAVAAAFERFNQARLTAGLAPVALDKTLSAACQAHADYLVRNAKLRDAKGFSVVDEDPSLPGFTPEGQAAAKRGDVFSLAPNSTTQIDDLFGTLHRRTFALDPRLRRIGLGCAHEIGQGWINVLDLNSGRDAGNAVAFPGFGQEKVQLQGRDRVPGEKASGYPITIWFPGRPTIRDVRASLAEPSGATIDIFVSTPSAPFEKADQSNLIAIHPRVPLRPGRVYSVTITAEVNGAPWRHSGRFSTIGD